MVDRRRFHALITCLAVLLHLLAMPVSGAMPAEAKRMMGCEGHYLPTEGALHTAQHHAQHQHHDEVPQPLHHHANMQHCCCGASTASQAGLASMLAPSFHAPAVFEIRLLPQPPPRAYIVRHYWPSLNPRASPV
ncbi:DUF2946 family protein [Phytohalomonas tamaricis]|uniref:DUF2946 family protein n=1 Tax=Phytohalomonas tamaricis TaxID=2081032 RepID=UPI000D0B48A8|nr:DUF2946 family protein [Phytohalomonas tamaricis]